MKILFAQGNPESEYKFTRHNIGMELLDSFVKQHDGEWKLKKAFHASIAELTVGGEKVLCVKPTTYYNETGRSIRAIVDFYKLNPASDVLVLHDDLALPFGTIRTRKKGSDAGNNGIKSINTALGQEYTRIRIGVWNELRDRMDDATFVLSKFSKQESDNIDKVLWLHIEQLLVSFCDGSLEDTTLQTEIK